MGTYTPTGDYPPFDNYGRQIIYVEPVAYCSRCAELEDAKREIARLKAEVARLQRSAFIRSR